MKRYALWGEIHAVDELRRRIKMAVIVGLILTWIMGTVLLVMYCRFDYSLRIGIDTQHYLYSSLIQAYATMAGLLLALMGFLYQRIRDRQKAYLEEAAREAHGFRANLPKDLGAIRDAVHEWYRNEHKVKLDQVDRACENVKKLMADPSQSQQAKASLGNLRGEMNSLSTDVARYRLIASLLTRTKRLDDHFRDEVPASLIMAVGSTLLVVAGSIALLVSSDHLGNLHAFLTIASVLLAGLSLWYVGSFIREMLLITFGLGTDSDFESLGWDLPDRDENIIAKIKKTLDV